jgi:MoxR-like ATPase
MRCARVEAVLDGREYLLPDDIRVVAPLVVGHRLAPSSEALLEGFSAIQIYREIEQQIAIPKLAEAS